MNGNDVFWVKDSGIGIQKSKHELIFNNFSQADSNTTREYGGTGLGLAITKMLVELQNGKVLRWVSEFLLIVIFLNISIIT